MQELGVFCGTFNPVHWGHLLLAERARDQFGLSKVLFITSARPPHRHLDLLDGESRHRMVEEAVKENPYFEACRLELDRPGLSFTVDTLRQLTKTYGPEVRLSLLVGGDNISLLNQWNQSGEIFQLCRLLVAPRLVPGEAGERAPVGADLAMIDLTPVPVSSSEIRCRLRQGRSVLYLVPPAVNSLLTAHSYYQTTPNLEQTGLLPG